MSLKASVVLEWADNEYPFALKGAQIEELQHVCGDIGFGAIFQRVMLGVWKFQDLYHVIRLGLIGGGMGEVEAKRMCDFYVSGKTGDGMLPLVRGPNSPESVARAVLGAVMQGIEFEEPPKGEASAGERPADQDGGTSPNTAPPSSVMG